MSWRGREGRGEREEERERGEREAFHFVDFGFWLNELALVHHRLSSYHVVNECTIPQMLLQTVSILTEQKMGRSGCNTLSQYCSTNIEKKGRGRSLERRLYTVI